MQNLTQFFESEAIVSKLEFEKDKDGNHVYDMEAIRKFREKKIKSMQKQNEKIKTDPKKYKGYSVVDPEWFADKQVEIYKHNFRKTNKTQIN